MTGLVLSCASLLSKWGFGDGDVPDWLLDTLDERGIDYPDDWQEVLWTLVNEHLLPALDQRVELVRIETNHNPVRADTVDGVNVRDEWTMTAPTTVLTPESVTVPVDRVIEAIQRSAPS